jgi:hypothetical protein
MDCNDGSVDNTVYRAHEIIAYGCSGGQRAGEQQEMVDMFIHAWTGSVKGREEKVSRDGGSLGIQGRTLALASCEKPVRRFGFSWVSCRAQSPRGLSVRAAFTGMWDAILPAHHVNGSPRGPCIRAGLRSMGSDGACGTWISSTLHVICSPCGLCARTGLESLRRLNACGTWM